MKINHRPVKIVLAISLTAIALPVASPAVRADEREISPTSVEQCAPQKTVAVAESRKLVRFTDCDLRGRTVLGSRGITVTVPRTGTSVTAQALHRDGSSRLTATVNVRAGEVEINQEVQTAPTRSKIGRAAALDKCADGAYNRNQYRQNGAYKWYYYPGSVWESGIPDDPINRYPFIALDLGMSSGAMAPNDCGLPWAKGQSWNQGDTGFQPNVGLNGGCTGANGINSVGWMRLSSAAPSLLAVTCTWSSNGIATETDVAMRTGDGVLWWYDDSGTGFTGERATTALCPAGRYYAEAVAAHEAGHVFGLAHVTGEQHANLTMYPTIDTCDLGPSRYGRGDNLGIVSIYGKQ